jgi:L-alanine-DL-glutamate epimerase-like enolase superfamily enzyme
MKIQDIITYPVAVPFKTPFTDALGTVAALPHVIVEITTDEEVSGWGEINTNHPSWEENLGGAIYAVNRIFKPALIGRDPTQPEVIQSIMDSLTPLNTLTKGGIDIAIYDILGKALNVPIYKLFGGCFRKDVLGLWDISLGPPADMAKEAQTVADKYGFRVRACLGSGWKTDLKRYSAIRHALGPDETIATEANMGWTPNEAIRAISSYQDDNVSFVEQPVSRFDLEGLRRIARSVRIPVVADESLHTPEDAWRLAKTQAVTCFNV